MANYTNIKTKVVHSKTKNAWNLVGVLIPGKYKIARFPYEQVEGSEVFNQREKEEAFQHAEFCMNAFNNNYKKP